MYICIQISLFCLHSLLVSREAVVKQHYRVLVELDFYICFSLRYHLMTSHYVRYLFVDV